MDAEVTGPDRPAPPGEAARRWSGPPGEARRRWSGRRVCVAGLGVSGPPVARALAALDARVTVVDGRDDDTARAAAAALEPLGVRVRLGAPPAGDPLPAGTELVVTSPGWRPDAPLLVAAARAGLPVLSDVDLAADLRPPGQRWLAVTGTNGKTTTVRMLAAMLEAAGWRAVAAGNVGTSLVEVVRDARPYEVIAVELSSFQLHWSRPVPAHAAAILNVAPDHLDWHGSFAAYSAAKAAILTPGAIAVGNADDPESARLVAAAAGAARRVTVTSGEPGRDQLGVVSGRLIDRAFGPAHPGEPAGTVEPVEPVEPVELAALADIAPLVPHNVANALAAAALARAAGAGAAAVRAGLRAFRPDPHRASPVADVGGVGYVDDSKATNPHAAAASIAGYRSVVWVAGGLLKGADVEDLVRQAAGRLRGVVLIGRDREPIARALARHAPNVPVVEVVTVDTEAMNQVVTAAAGLAHPGDTVLLAPAAASFDMFADYKARGEAFVRAVHRLAAARPAGVGDQTGRRAR